MALVPLNDIKNWFKTNFIPTQQQFWDMFDSFRHKSDKVAATDVEGLNNLLATKASNEAFNTHTTANNAHAALFGAKASNEAFNAHTTANNAHAALFGAKVDKDGTKGLSDQNYSLQEKEKLAGIEDVIAWMSNANFMGTATPNMNPGSQTIAKFWIATEAGTYANFGNLTVGANAIAILAWNGTAWDKTESTIDLVQYMKNADIIKGVGKNLFNKDILTNAYISTVDGSVVENETSRISDFMPVLPNTTYFISGRSGNNNLAYYDASKTLITTGSYTSAMNGAITTPANAYFVRMTVVFVGTGSIDITQFEKGGIETSYVSYSIGVQAIKDSPIIAKYAETAEGIKLLDDLITRVTTSITKSPNLFDKNTLKDGYYISTSDWGLTGGGVTGWATSEWIKVSPNMAYTINGEQLSTRAIQYADADKLKISGGMIAENPRTFTTPANCEYIIFTVRQNGQPDTYQSIMLNEGSISLPFEDFYITEYIDKINGHDLPISVTPTDLKEVSDLTNENKDTLTSLNTLLGTRINLGENTSTPQAFPQEAEATYSFGITVSPDTESPVKDRVGYKKTFLNTLMSSGQTCYQPWDIPIEGLRPSKFSIAFWTKKTEFQNIFTSGFESYLDLSTFHVNPTAAISGTPVIANGTASAAFSSAKMEFAKIAESGDYIRIRLNYFDLVWKETFTDSEITYFFLFNGVDSQNKPLTIVDYTVLLDNDIVGENVYPDNGTLQGTETLKGAYSISKNALNKIALLESEMTKGEMQLKKAGNSIYIASPWNSTHNLVKKISVNTSSYSSNPNANFDYEYLSPKGSDITAYSTTIKGSGDDICPANLNDSYIGGNHSWNQGCSVRMVAHGKTIADIGAVYKNASNVEFVVLRIVDVDNIWMASKNQSVDGVTYSFATPSGTLTYVSNGQNTGNIVTNAVSGLGNTYTSITPSVIKILKDGITEITADGTYYGKFFDLVESYDALDLPSIVTQLTANRPSGGYTTAPQLNSLSGTQKLFNHNLNYRFTDNGNTIVSTTFRAYKKLKMSFHGFVQAGALDMGNVYVPKSLPISDGAKTYDLRQIQDWTAPPSAPLNLTPTYWENPLSPPDRVLNMNNAVNFMIGYITDRGIESNRKDVVHNAIFLNTSRKLYPMGINNASQVTIEANTFYSAVAYRCYSNPANNPSGRTNYTYVEVGGDTFIYLDYHGALNDFIDSKPEWLGKKINVYEKNSKCLLIGDVVNGKIEIVSTATATDYGYIVLKIN